MADQLGRIRGRFLLSINDTAEIRETFADFIIDEVRPDLHRVPQCSHNQITRTHHLQPRRPGRAVVTVVTVGAV